MEVIDYIVIGILIILNSAVFFQIGRKKRMEEIEGLFEELIKRENDG